MVQHTLCALEITLYLQLSHIFYVPGLVNVFLVNRRSHKLLFSLEKIVRNPRLLVSKDVFLFATPVSVCYSPPLSHHNLALPTLDYETTVPLLIVITSLFSTFDPFSFRFYTQFLLSQASFEAVITGSRRNVRIAFRRNNPASTRLLAYFLSVIRRAD